jgi:hypothetical protein
MKIKFSIRHLFIVVTLFGVLFSWLAYKWNIVQQRKSLALAFNQAWHGQPPTEYWYKVDDDDLENVSWIRRVLGDPLFSGLYLPDDTPQELLDRTQKYIGVKRVPCPLDDAERKAPSSIKQELGK